MKKGTVLALLAALAAGAAAAAMLRTQNRQSEEDKAPESEPTEDTGVNLEDAVSTRLKNKYVDYSAGAEHPRYLLELETPEGIQEIAVSAEQYEDCYIGDEVLCVKTGDGYRPV